MKAAAVFIFCALAGLAVTQQARGWPNVRQVNTLSYGSASDVVVSIADSSGDVNVTGWDQNSIEVTTTKTAWSSSELARLQTDVKAQHDRFSIATIYPKHCIDCDISFDVHVPRGARVTIETSSGDASIASVTGQARINSSSGDVKVHDVKGALNVHSSSGEISLDRIGSTVDAYASSGDIKARHLSADANLVASSGTVSAEFSDFGAVHQVRMESSSGDVELTVPRGVGFKIEASTTSGSIDSNLKLPIRDFSSGSDVVAQVGDGKASVQLRATSGDITVTMR